MATSKAKKTSSKTSKVEHKETYQFGAETGKILQLMIHSLYTNKDIFLRELISNASDALDKLRYEAITKPDLVANNQTLKIKISTNEKQRTLTISDNGIGMNKQDLKDNLGTIARSGTQSFLESLSGDSKRDIQLIGQFGVGFYSSFMVAKEVEVISRKAGEDHSWHWQSQADGEYTIEAAKENRSEQGTEIILHINEGLDEFLDKHRIDHIVKTYSDHISFPVEFTDSEGNTKVINEGSALWAKPKSEITEEQYNEFYKHIAHAADKPWLILHNKAEGIVSYTNLLFIPTFKPFDLFHPDRETRLRLYVKKVFITDKNTDLIPKNLRFVRGVVDSEDLPLNISRETLQHNSVIHKIKGSITKKILGEFKKKAENDPESYAKFWENFGSTLKEGLCEGLDANRELLFEVCRFKTTKSGDKLISLDEYVKNMPEDHKFIYFLTGNNGESLEKNPQLEGFIRNNIEVLLLSDHVDDFWTTNNHQYKDIEFKSVTRTGIKLDGKSDDIKEKNTENKSNDYKKLIAFIKEVLGNRVRDVVESQRLSDSPVCLTIPEGGMDMRLERFLIEQKQLNGATPKILEINTNNKIIEYIGKQISHDKTTANELVELLYDQACLIEGEPIKDSGSFARRMNNLIEQVIKG